MLVCEVWSQGGKVRMTNLYIQNSKVQFMYLIDVCLSKWGFYIRNLNSFETLEMFAFAYFYYYADT